MLAEEKAAFEKRADDEGIALGASEDDDDDDSYE